MTKVASTATPARGGHVTFTVVVTNAGPNPATGVTVTEALPAGLTFVRAAASTGTTYASATGLWAVGALAAGTSAPLQLVATAVGRSGRGSRTRRAWPTGTRWPRMRAITAPARS